MQHNHSPQVDASLFPRMHPSNASIFSAFPPQTVQEILRFQSEIISQASSSGLHPHPHPHHQQQQHERLQPQVQRQHQAPPSSEMNLKRDRASEVPSQSQSQAAKRQRRVSKACVACRLIKRSCDGGYPCTRCVERGCAHSCSYIPRKKKERRQKKQNGSDPSNQRKTNGNRSSMTHGERQRGVEEENNDDEDDEDDDNEEDDEGDDDHSASDGSVEGADENRRQMEMRSRSTAIPPSPASPIIPCSSLHGGQSASQAAIPAAFGSGNAAGSLQGMMQSESSKPWCPSRSASSSSGIIDSMFPFGVSLVDHSPPYSFFNSPIPTPDIRFSVSHFEPCNVGSSSSHALQQSPQPAQHPTQTCIQSASSQGPTASEKNDGTENPHSKRSTAPVSEDKHPGGETASSSSSSSSSSLADSTHSESTSSSGSPPIAPLLCSHPAVVEYLVAPTERIRSSGLHRFLQKMGGCLDQDFFDFLTSNRKTVERIVENEQFVLSSLSRIDVILASDSLMRQALESARLIVDGRKFPTYILSRARGLYKFNSSLVEDSIYSRAELENPSFDPMDLVDISSCSLTKMMRRFVNAQENPKIQSYSASVVLKRKDHKIVQYVAGMSFIRHSESGSIFYTLIELTPLPKD
eukprot:ANDGO_07098.mRNA.1 hypothetical protein